MVALYSYSADMKESEGSGDDDDFRADVRRVWHRTWEELEALSPTVAPQRNRMIKSWTALGNKCGVDVNAPYDPSAELLDNAGPRGAKRCAWKECLCFGERPNHRLRMCKRCTKVLYCSSKCQKRYVTEVTVSQCDTPNSKYAEIGMRVDTNVFVDDLKSHRDRRSACYLLLSNSLYPKLYLYPYL